MLSILVGAVLIAVLALLSWWYTPEGHEPGHGTEPVERGMTYGETQGLLRHTHQFPPGVP